MMDDWRWVGDDEAWLGQEWWRWSWWLWWCAELASWKRSGSEVDVVVKVLWMVWMARMIWAQRSSRTAAACMVQALAWPYVLSLGARCPL